MEKEGYDRWNKVPKQYSFLYANNHHTCTLVTSLMISNANLKLYILTLKP